MQGPTVGISNPSAKYELRTAIFQNSFFPATVVFPQVAVDQTSLDAFKTALVSQHIAY